MYKRKLQEIRTLMLDKDLRVLFSEETATRYRQRFTILERKLIIMQLETTIFSNKLENLSLELRTKTTNFMP
jgi:hypothetical protein